MPTRVAKAFGEFSQIENVDVRVNTDVESRPLAPWDTVLQCTVLCWSAFQQKIALVIFVLISFCYF